VTADGAPTAEARPGSDEDHPASVAWTATAIRGWIRRLGELWIEGQLSQVSVRRDIAFVTLRDLAAESSLSVFIPSNVLRQAGTLEQGQHVVVRAAVDFWTKRGELQLRAVAIRAVGLGELLADLERLKTLLAAEGLFAPERKRDLPFLPKRIGLISGRNSDAEHDVITNAQRRWPAVQFEVRSTPVQGPRTVAGVVAALQDLDALPGVEVIVITRGGGSVEDLLPFSNEALVRAVAQAATPVVSAIGHEKDSPILDLVADLRASTPTDAGKRIVPDFAEEVRGVRDLRVRARRAVAARFDRESALVAELRARPVLATPGAIVAERAGIVDELLGRSRRSLMARIDADRSDVAHLRSRVRALSPAATLDRGYAVVQTPDGGVVRSPEQVRPGDRLRIRVAAGEFPATAIDEGER